MCNIIKKKRVTESKTVDASAPPPPPPPSKAKPPSPSLAEPSVPGSNTALSADRLTNESDRNPQKVEHSKSAKEVGSKARSSPNEKKEKEKCEKSKQVVPMPTLITRRNERDKQMTTEHTQDVSSEQKSTSQPASRMGDIPFCLVTSSQPKKKKRSLTKTMSVPSSLKSSTDGNSKEKPKGNPEDDTVYPENQRQLAKERKRNRTPTSVSESAATSDAGSHEKLADVIGVSPTQDDDGPENYMYSDDDIVFVCHEQIAGLENDDLTRLEDFALMTRPFSKWNPYATVEEMEDRHLFTRGVLAQYTLTSTGMTFPNQNDVAHILDGSERREKALKSRGTRVTFTESKEKDNDLMALNKEDVLLKKPVKENSASLSENKTMNSVSKLSNMSKLRCNKSIYKDDVTNESERSIKKGRSVSSKKSSSRRGSSRTRK